MKILAMDSAAASCSVALWQDDALKDQALKEMTRGHASELLPMVEALLAKNALSVSDLDAFAVTIGPGAFTGLRIGLSAARGFAVATKKPVIGVTTLEALNQGVTERPGPVLCALDAKRADLYAQVFARDGTALSEPVARLPEDLMSLIPPDAKTVTVCGDSFDRVKNLLQSQGVTPICSEVRLPQACYVAEIAKERAATVDGQARPSALYIRPPDAALPKNGGRLRP